MRLDGAHGVAPFQRLRCRSRKVGCPYDGIHMRRCYEYYVVLVVRVVLPPSVASERLILIEP